MHNQTSVSLLSWFPKEAVFCMSVHTDEYFAVYTLITYPEWAIKPRSTKQNDLRFSSTSNCIFVIWLT